MKTIERFQKEQAKGASEILEKNNGGYKFKAILSSIISYPV